MKKTLFTLIATLLVTIVTNAQSSRSIENIESITSNNVSILKFGASGKVWASTPGFGCAVFDSSTNSWSAFTPTNSPMKSDTITGIDLYGIAGVPNSFMATTNGVYYRHGTTWDSLTSLPDAYATGIIKSPDGRLYVSTHTGISVYKSDSLYHITDYTINNSTLPFANISTLQFKEINATGFYGATADSGYFYTNDEISYHAVNAGNSRLISNQINSLLISADTSKHYVGTKQGLSVYSSGNFTNYTTAQGLPENDVTAVEIDCKGDMWVGTRNSGIGIYDGTSFTYLNHTNVLPSNKITTINCNAQCQCWVGTMDSGIIVFDSARNVKEIILDAEEISPNDLSVLVFPQPALGIVNFKLNESIAQADIVLCDMTGQTVITEPVSNRFYFTLNVGSLTNGIYFYTLKSDNTILKTGKVFISNKF